MTDLPADLPDSLDAALISDSPPSAFPNGCHVAEVEIDPETGAVALERYVAVDDFGTLVNPMLVEGQVHGGVAQGIGQALMEQAVYDRAGQLLTGSFMDYCLPRADRVPAFEVAFHPVPATSNPLGVKGCGEAGVTGALPAVMNAVRRRAGRARRHPPRHAGHARPRLAGAARRRCRRLEPRSAPAPRPRSAPPYPAAQAPPAHAAGAARSVTASPQRWRDRPRLDRTPATRSNF